LEWTKKGERQKGWAVVKDQKGHRAALSGNLRKKRGERHTKKGQGEPGAPTKKIKKEEGGLDLTTKRNNETTRRGGGLGGGGKRGDRGI